MSKKIQTRLIVCSFLSLTMTAAPLSATGNDVSIVVLSDIQNTLKNRVKYEAVDVICDELRLSGFNVVERRGSPFEGGLRNALEGVFREHAVSAAVVVTESSPKDGTVTLFVDYPDRGIESPAAFFIEFPLNRDRAEIVAFKVSENVSFFTEGVTNRAGEGGTSAVKTPGADKETRSDADVQQATSTVRPEAPHFAVYAHLGGEYSPGGTGVFGAAGIGARWYPALRKSLDLSLSIYPLGRDMGTGDSGASFDFLLVKIRGGFELRSGRRFRVNPGVSLGFGYVWMHGYPLESDADNETGTVRKDVGDFFPYAGGSLELIYTVSPRLFIPVRFDVGAAMTKVSVVFSGEEVATFGLPIMELSFGMGGLF